VSDPAAPTRPRESTRLAWADAAKGACILLVVLHHTTLKHYLPMVPEAMTPVAATWEAVTGALKPVRMPLFFLLAGLFAANAVRRPWSQVLTQRVLTPYWLYAVWLGIGGVVFTIEQTMVTNRARGVGELGGDLLWASTSAWFLYALAVYFVVAKLTCDLDTRRVLGAAALLAVSVSALPMTAANREAVLMHLGRHRAGRALPLLATAALALASLALHRILVLAGLSALFTLPDSLRPSERTVVGLGRRLRAAGARTRLAPRATLWTEEPSRRTAHLPAMR
jgi:uncharacterized membrane protein YcfT